MPIQVGDWLQHQIDQYFLADTLTRCGGQLITLQCHGVNESLSGIEKQGSRGLPPKQTELFQ